MGRPACQRMKAVSARARPSSAWKHGNALVGDGVQVERPQRSEDERPGGRRTTRRTLMRKR